jgi:hypothetical protein
MDKRSGSFNPGRLHLVATGDFLVVMAKGKVFGTGSEFPILLSVALKIQPKSVRLFCTTTHRALSLLGA